MVALFFETLAVLPAAVGFLLWTHGQGEGAWLDGDASVDALLVGTGVITAFPLVWFAHAARRLRLSTLGTLQYVSPSLGMIIAIAVFGEAFGLWHGLAFVAIWMSLGLWGADAARARRTG
jgi:chloramphenicol-sensitive protein RarD